MPRPVLRTDGSGAIVDICDHSNKELLTSFRLGARYYWEWYEFPEKQKEIGIALDKIEEEILRRM
jgi:hypothetical protein